jgi:hypothetical protein
LTQGYQNNTDPFNATAVALVVTSSGVFADPVAVVCEVTDSTKAVVTDPSCSLSSATMTGTTGNRLTYTLKASAQAAIGVYAVALRATDNSHLLLSKSTVMPLYVVGVANTLSLAQGARGTVGATFNTSSLPSGSVPVAPMTFACGTVWNAENRAVVPISSLTGLNCTGTGWVPGNPTATAQITVWTNGTATAQLQRSSTIFAATFLGLPILALMGWVGSRKSPRKNCFRFLGLLLLLVGFSYATGCGGSFTSQATAGTNGMAVGNYLVQVVGTDSVGNKYYAGIPLVVSSNSLK